MISHMTVTHAIPGGGTVVYCRCSWFFTAKNLTEARAAGDLHLEES